MLSTQSLIWLIHKVTLALEYIYGNFLPNILAFKDNLYYPHKYFIPQYSVML